MNTEKTGPRLSPVEERFLERCRSGDREALTGFVERHYDQVYRLSYSMVGPNDAHDLAQDAFTAAISSMRSFRGQAKISTWLISILRNRYALFLRGRKKWRHASLEEVGAATVPKTESIEPGMRTVLEKMKELPDDLRMTTVLFYLEGLKYSEIAEAMECPVGTVRSRLFDARERLRKALAMERTP